MTKMPVNKMPIKIIMLVNCVSLHCAKESENTMWRKDMRMT